VVNNFLKGNKMELQTIIGIFDGKKDELSKEQAGASITGHAIILAQMQLIDEFKKVFTDIQDLADQAISKVRIENALRPRVNR
jgi:hypothetical protein